MSDLWNLWDVKPPPTCRTKQLLNRKEILKLVSDLGEMISTLNQLPHLDKEAGLLSRFLYLNKRAFRHDKGLRNLVQIYQCLKRYLKLDFYSTVTNYKSTLPVNISPKVTHAFLPTKQMLQWLLLRLQTFSKLFARIIKLSTVASHHIYGKLCLGWSMKQTIFMYGINARLLVISKYIVSKCIEWYDKLYDYLIIFDSDSNFSSYYSCPRDLKTWLGRDANVSPLSDKNQIIDNLFKMMEMKMRSRKKTEEEDETAVAYYKFLSKFFESDRATTILSQSDDVEEEEEEDGVVVVGEDDDKRGKDTNENLNEREKKRKIENVEDVGGE
ncbi:conserved hypothetical protein [Pediculus humanus corporis]|uniref:Nucleolus and neural progenitor protein-like N-terminal domain-containing protein n=1 Tax=Pediculus humanus subsp. corporis TaxID=121224 RepID=E0W397_PEDHC|nr:uncharacterized protein Phum_PHUM602330 [Pediculus humanus corporis]EEB20103.1 conserved hypothetical protein [Pediculus humanus corporis]